MSRRSSRRLRRSKLHWDMMMSMPGARVKAGNAMQYRPAYIDRPYGLRGSRRYFNSAPSGRVPRRRYYL